MKPVEMEIADVSDTAIRKATGKGWDEWFALLDERGGPSLGRRAISVYLWEEHKLEAWSATINVEYEAARSVVAKDGRPQGYNICATKTVGAPVEVAYAAWTTVDALQQWFADQVKLEFTDGGALSSSDGDAATITKIRPNKAIRLAWNHAALAPGTVVEVTFQPKGEKSIIMVSHDRIQSRTEADQLRSTWAATLDKLKAVLEG